MSKKVILDSLQKDSESAARDISGVAAAWASLNMSTATGEDSLNITSYSDLATGRFDYTFTNAMANDDFAMGGGGEDNVFLSLENGQRTTADFEARARNSSSTLVDSVIATAIIMGDLA